MKEFIELLALLREEKNVNINYEDLVSRYQAYLDRFDRVQNQWVIQMKAGPSIDFESILDLLQKEKKRRIANNEYPSPKRLNPLYILSSISDKLNAFRYVGDQDVLEDSCNCKVRLRYRLAPEIKFLKKIGSSIDWGGVVFDIMECEKCEMKWVKDNAGGAGIIIDHWKKWDKEEFPLKEEC